MLSSVDFFKIFLRGSMKHPYLTGDASIFFYDFFAFHVVQFIIFFILYSFDRGNCLICSSGVECSFNILVFLTVRGQLELVKCFLICFLTPVRWNYLFCHIMPDLMHSVTVTYHHGKNWIGNSSSRVMISARGCSYELG